MRIGREINLAYMVDINIMLIGSEINIMLIGLK